jgi:hypothetical protein
MLNVRLSRVAVMSDNAISFCFGPGSKYKSNIFGARDNLKAVPVRLRDHYPRSIHKPLPSQDIRGCCLDPSFSIEQS